MAKIEITDFQIMMLDLILNEQLEHKIGESFKILGPEDDEVDYSVASHALIEELKEDIRKQW